MNLETRLDPRLWDAIRASWTARNYSASIIDSVFFLSELMREKTGLESDGASLVSQAFGGKTPKLKVNRLQSESDWNVQKGLEQLLRGFYQAIRNPRSHEKHSDTPEDAEAIIAFVNYIVRVIDQSKTPFTKEEFLRRVFDPDFVEDSRYATLLVEEIPPRQRFDIFIDAYRAKESGRVSALKYFFAALLDVLSDEEKAKIHQVVSEELKTTDSDETIAYAIQILPADCWPKYSEVARLRIEHKLLKSMQRGKYDSERSERISGHLGILIRIVVDHLTAREDFVRTMYIALEYGERFGQDYVLQYFVPSLDSWFDDPPASLVRVLKAGIEEGDKHFNDAVDSMLMFSSSGPWYDALKKSLESFSEKDEGPIKIEDDDLPF